MKTFSSIQRPMTSPDGGTLWIFIPPSEGLPFRPRTLIGVPPKDLCVSGGNHFLLNVGRPKEQLCHGSSIAIIGDPTDSNLLAHHKISQMVSSSSGWHWLSFLPNLLRSVDAGESNPLSGCRGAGVAVVAGGDHNGCKSSKERQ